MSQVSYGTITITDTTDIERIYTVYAKSVDNTTIPQIAQENWSETVSAAPGLGNYIWQRTVVEKSGTEEKTYSDPVCLTGEEGTDGKGITTIVVKYGTSADWNTQPSNWYDNTPEYSSSTPNYWTQTTINYTTGSPDIKITQDQALTEAIYNAVVANSIATNANENSQGALSQAAAAQQLAIQVDTLLGGHFSFGDALSIKTPAGARIVEQIKEGAIDVASNPSKWLHNVIIGSNGIQLRYNEAVMAQLAANQSSNNTALKFYKPPTISEGTTTQGDLAMELNSSELTFFNLENNTLNRALVINNNGIDIYGTYINPGDLPVSNTQLAHFGSTTTIGPTSSRHIQLSSNNLYFKNNTSVLGGINFSNTHRSEEDLFTYSLTEDSDLNFSGSLNYHPYLPPVTGYFEIIYTDAEGQSQTINSGEVDLSNTYSHVFTATETVGSDLILHRFDISFDPGWKSATSSTLSTDFDLQVDSSEEAILNIRIAYTADINGPHYLFGREVQSIGENALATGRGTIALGDFQFVTGKYNQPNKDAVFIIGNGEENNRSNLMEVGADLITMGNEFGRVEITPTRTSFFSGYVDDISQEIARFDQGKTIFLPYTQKLIDNLRGSTISIIVPFEIFNDELTYTPLEGNIQLDTIINDNQIVGEFPSDQDYQDSLDGGNLLVDYDSSASTLQLEWNGPTIDVETGRGYANGTYNIWMVGTATYSTSVTYIFEYTPTANTEIIVQDFDIISPAKPIIFTAGVANTQTMNAGWMTASYYNISYDGNKTIVVSYKSGSQNYSLINMISYHINAVEVAKAQVTYNYKQCIAPTFSFGLNQTDNINALTTLIGEGLIAGADNQTVIGKYNAIDVSNIFIIGNGISDNDRSNTLTVDINGNITLISKSPSETNRVGSLYFDPKSTNNKKFAVGPSPGSSGENIDVGWSYANKEGAGIGLRSSNYSNSPGAFSIYAQNATQGPYSLNGSPNGQLRWGGDLYLKGHSSPVGTIKYASAVSPAITSIPSGAAKSVASFLLEAGVWIIIGGIRWAGSTAGGYRRMSITTAQNAGDVQHEILPVNSTATGAYTQTNLTRIVELTSSTTFYLNAYHNAGSNLTVSNVASNYGTYMYAVRIA